MLLMFCKLEEDLILDLQLKCEVKRIQGKNISYYFAISSLKTEIKRENNLTEAFLRSLFLKLFNQRG